MLHTFDAPSYMNNEKYMKKCDCNHVFHVFLIFCVVGSIKSMKHGYYLDEESILHPMNVSTQNLSKPIGR